MDAAQSVGGVTLSRPEVISPVERRRAPRRRLQRGVSVRLNVGPEGDRTPTSPIEAMLLNLSPSGLACRVDASSSALLECGDRIRVEFNLPSVRVPFALSAIVVTKTRGSGDHHVIGLEFMVDRALHAREHDLRRGLSALTGAVCGMQLD